jgi:hypothetical protein
MRLPHSPSSTTSSPFPLLALSSAKFHAKLKTFLFNLSFPP